MQTHEHTPGPWRLDRGMSDSIFVRAGYSGMERTIVLVSKTTSEFETRRHSGHEEHITRTRAVPNAEADARLIAAAPDMLAALRKAVQQLEQLGSDGLASGANAAIAKATGDASND